MRKIENLNTGWNFTGPDKRVIEVNVPHTWNNIDGQDGGNDYWRGTCRYEKTLEAVVFDTQNECVYLEFQGVNASARVFLNDIEVCSHDGGYSTFRVEITEYVQKRCELVVEVDNSVNDSVYPQKADFTFYGGIYRDVNMVVVNKNHFDMDHYGGTGLKITPAVKGQDGFVEMETYTNLEGEQDIHLEILNDCGVSVTTGKGKHCTLTIPKVHLWDGLKDPYLYTAVAQLLVKGQVVDEVRSSFGVRTFFADPKKGFFLNGRSYPLRGVSRHQDWKDIGNAITEEHHRQDLKLICEIGANTVRLAHYQHDQYFYNLCDEYGLVVWAEIPYISEHMPGGRENTISQMQELIIQNYNHPSIVCWGISNEITISTGDKKDMLDNHHVLNDLCHRMDSTRLTTLACYAMCGPFNKSAHISDLVSWNLYLGWYVPGLFLNDLWMKFFHLCYPNRCLGYSEYGCEAMPNLHSSKPHRGDHTEEYQAIYHEYMLKCFERNPYLWATHVWNMFDFAADARDQGGEAGMNHKGLVTFDRKTKKDSFYLYKAYWSDEPFVHLCSSRYVDRPESEITVKIYSNQSKVALYCDGKLVEEIKGSKVFIFKLSISGKHQLKAVAGTCEDKSIVCKVDRPNSSYRLAKQKTSANWV